MAAHACPRGVRDVMHALRLVLVQGGPPEEPVADVGGGSGAGRPAAVHETDVVDEAGEVHGAGTFPAWVHKRQDFLEFDPVTGDPHGQVGSPMQHAVSEDAEVRAVLSDLLRL